MCCCDVLLRHCLLFVIAICSRRRGDDDEEEEEEGLVLLTCLLAYLIPVPLAGLLNFGHYPQHQPVQLEDYQLPRDSGRYAPWPSLYL